MVINSKIKIENLKVVAILLLVFILSSCSLQKRLYNKGFYVSKSHTIENKKLQKDTSFFAKITSPKKNTMQALIASAKKNATDFFVSPKWLVNGCDTIYLKSGGRIYAHVTEINLTKVLFTKCGEDDDKVLFVKKDDVGSITYANGSNENYGNGDSNNNNSNPPPDKHEPKNLPGQQNSNTIPDFYGNPTQNQYQQNAHSHNYNQPASTKRKLNAFSLIGFIISGAFTCIFIIIAALLGMISIMSHQNAFAGLFGPAHFSPFLILPVVFIVIALAFCLIAIIQIKTKGEENYKGLKIAYIGLALCLLLLLLMALIIF